MAGRVILANAFSLNMLNLPRGLGVSVCIEELDLEKWAGSLKYHLAQGELECVIGHKSTVELAEKLLSMPALVGEDVEVELNCERKAIKLEPGDTVYILQPRIRLPEGKILDYKEIAQLLREGKLGFYAVHYGPC